MRFALPSLILQSGVNVTREVSLGTRVENYGVREVFRQMCVTGSTAGSITELDQVGLWLKPRLLSWRWSGVGTAHLFLAGQSVPGGCGIAWALVGLQSNLYCYLTILTSVLFSHARVRKRCKILPFTCF